MLKMINYLNSYVDRTFLYLMSIYAIHGILLNFFFMHPQFDNATTNWNVIISDTSNGNKSEIIGRNSNILEIEERSIVITDAKNKWNDGEACVNNTFNDCLRLAYELLNPLQFSGVDSCYSLLSELEVSYFKLMSCSSTVLKDMSPGILGMILGCIVFTLTFTDNMNDSWQ